MFINFIKNCPITKELDTLHFNDNNLNDKSVKFLYHNLYKFPKLKVLELCNNKNIKEEGTKLLLYKKMKSILKFNFTISSIYISLFYSYFRECV